MSRTLVMPTNQPGQNQHKQAPTSTIASIPLLAKRDLNCGEGYHHCLDINHADQCCDNKSYCYINRAYEPRCCPIGSNCVSDNVCKSDHYYCTTVLTTITTGNSTTSGCCGKRCPQTSYYLCPSTLGGKCCPYGSDCQADGNCVSKYTASTTALIPTCSTCTPISTQSMTVVEVDSGRLSSGAKAGIGVGIALSMSLLLAFLAWCLILYKRRRHVRDADKVPDVRDRAELMAVAGHVPEQDAGNGEPGQEGAATALDAAPVEMASDEAPPSEQEPSRSVSPWENGARIESVEGIFELDGLQVYVPTPPPPPEPEPEPEPNVCFPNHLDKM